MVDEPPSSKPLSHCEHPTLRLKRVQHCTAECHAASVDLPDYRYVAHGTLHGSLYEAFFSGVTKEEIGMSYHVKSHLSFVGNEKSHNDKFNISLDISGHT